MLSSIHPLGERARGNRWMVTITAFALGAGSAGASMGAVLGGAGSLLPLPSAASPLLLGGAAVVAAALDLAARPAPGPRRQVNERWIGEYRGWVYGAGFGAQLGVGTATFVVTWGVWAAFVAMLLAGSAGRGALVGAVFGLGRAALPMAAGWVDRPSRLTTFTTRLASAAGPARTLAPLLLAAAAATAWVG